MLKSISYKKRLKILGVAFLLAIFISYRYSILLTIDQYHEYNSYGPKKETNEPEILPKENLIVKEKQLDALFSRFLLDTTRADKNLLLLTSNYCKNNQVYLKEYRPFHLSDADSIQILTRVIEIGGAFTDCLKFIYQLETEDNAGRISSIEFKSFIDPQDKKTKLTCILYVQNLINYVQENK